VGSADTATQNAQSAAKNAGDAQVAAVDAVHRADSLDSVVKGLDSYKAMANVSVTFGFDKAVLTKDDKDQLDGFAAQLGSAKSYILEVTGGTDSTGPAQYNYDLSQRRADAVVQYLASKYGVAAHRFYLIGIGKDKEVAPNTTAEGRKQNRRVEIQLLTNMSGSEPQTPGTPGTGR
jgi:outer membrane protein OmpA-like peptidoglycan-associated protein